MKEIMEVKVEKVEEEMKVEKVEEEDLVVSARRAKEVEERIFEKVH